VRSFFFVLYSYPSKAALKMDWKLDVEEVEVEGVGWIWDIELIGNVVIARREQEVDRRRYEVGV
jgi:hypothetical protein